MENVEVGSRSPLVGLMMEATRHCTGAAIVAMIKKSGRLVVNPPEEEATEGEDRLVIIGTEKQLAALEETLKRESQRVKAGESGGF